MRIPAGNQIPSDDLNVSVKISPHSGLCPPNQNAIAVHRHFRPIGITGEVAVIRVVITFGVIAPIAFIKAGNYFTAPTSREGTRVSRKAYLQIIVGVGSGSSKFDETRREVWAANRR